jgi:hypothetical protein
MRQRFEPTVNSASPAVEKCEPGVAEKKSASALLPATAAEARQALPSSERDRANCRLAYEIVAIGSGGAIHAFPPPPSELFIVIRRERKAA